MPPTDLNRIQCLDRRCTCNREFEINANEAIEIGNATEAIGGSPQKLAFSEVYGALQQGVVDVQENIWSNIYGQKFFEVQDGVTENNLGIIDCLVATPVDRLEELDPSVRDQFLSILAEERNSATPRRSR